ncbi:MAG: hypothetical protein CM15mP128_1130 [Methanobacteriota archaeon]|nr:MAG: hypothetical protein CM15mP128_1130 [Euryarchaeota archaeon]
MEARGIGVPRIKKNLGRIAGFLSRCTTPSEPEDILDASWWPFARETKKARERLERGFGPVEQKSWGLDIIDTVLLLGGSVSFFFFSALLLESGAEKARPGALQIFSRF